MFCYNCNSINFDNDYDGEEKLGKRKKMAGSPGDDEQLNVMVMPMILVITLVMMMMALMTMVTIMIPGTLVMMKSLDQVHLEPLIRGHQASSEVHQEESVVLDNLARVLKAEVHQEESVILIQPICKT